MPTLHLIDGSAYMYRAFHALPPLSTSKGVPTGAVRGVASMLLRDLREQQPTHIAFCMDLDAKASRLEIYPEYKATRPPTPDELKQQFSLVREVVRSLEIPLVEFAGWEADDIIATLSRQAVARGWDVVIVSGDKDLMQLVRDGHVRFFDGMKNQWFDEAAVTAKWGVPPSLVGDLLSLTGDSSDNVPGVAGIGPKTAVTLLGEYGTLEGVLENAAQIKREKLRQSLLDNADIARLSKRLVTLNDALELPFGLDDLQRKAFDSTQARTLFGELEMFNLLKDLPAAPEAPQAEASRQKLEVSLVNGRAALEALARSLETEERIALKVVLGDGTALTAPLVGLSFATEKGAHYVPLGLGGLLGQSVLSEKVALEVLKPVLESEKPLKDGHSLKSGITALEARGVRLGGLGLDVETASFLLNSARKEHALEDLSRERLLAELPAPPQDARKRSRIASASGEELAPWAGQSADAVRRLVPLFVPELERDAQLGIWESMERPLLSILARMECAGIKVDGQALRTQSAGFEKDIDALFAEIQSLAGREFNPNAPAQLAEILFQDLKLPVIKKGKTGPSTDAEVLEKLAEEHPLPAKILEYRGLTKLKNTYLDTLPELIAQDGRIHTTFNPIGAATGRLSSNDPNLQNIPIRTEVGRRIRSAFIAEEGCELVSADYSQIELRILAHMSGDESLRDSFSRGEDVHTRTAAEIYDVTPLEVTSEMRRVAKMINYAIAYGLSPYGLSSRIGIERSEAKRIIDAYFARYDGVKRWLDETVKLGREKGWVSTITGRRRQLAELRSSNAMARMGAERAAVNAPIQGTAADIVKLAMLAVDAELGQHFPRARMLLQVHDELLFEAPKEDVPALVSFVKAKMEASVALAVPLVVDVGHGRSWAEAH